jgi:hypothetical protein
MEIRRLEYNDIPQLATLYEYFWHEGSNIKIWK